MGSKQALRRLVVTGVAFVVLAGGCSEPGSGSGQEPGSESGQEPGPDVVESEVWNEFDVCEQVHTTSFVFTSSGVPEILDSYKDRYLLEWGGYTGGPTGIDDVVVYVTDRPGFHHDQLRSELPQKVGLDVKVIDQSAAALFPIADQISEALDLAPPGYQEGVTVAPSGGASNRVWYRTERIDSLDTLKLGELVGSELIGPELVGQVCVDPLVGPKRSYGAQPQGGDGWRLLGESVTGPEMVGYATTWDEYESMWETAGVDAEHLEIDFGTEIALYLGESTSSCTNIILTDINIDLNAGVVEPVVEYPLCGRASRGIRLRHIYIVAVERSSLPDEFNLRSTGFDSGGSGLSIEVDLTLDATN